jgi:threonine synthase
MLYYSTNNASVRTDFRQATIDGLAPDKGLYFPERIPLFPNAMMEKIEEYENDEIAFLVIQPYVGSTIPKTDLAKIARESVNFEFPLKQVDGSAYALELYHGPTLAFKDVGARFMSRCLGYFAQTLNKQITVLVATSGDTGGAVAAGFAGVEGVNVVILYPSGKVSSVQQMQLTTWGDNIAALEVEGSFDDCQQMVKQAFADESIKKNLFLTSANSINIARWLPQQFYYLFAYKQWKHKEHPPVISVPSGNFGNICAGLLAKRSGLPVPGFIAACNANDTIPEFFKQGVYHPKKAVPTISNAMDVGNPSNFVRILELFGQDQDALKKVVTSYSISDNETRAAMQEVYKKHAYLMDPHGAVGYIALKKYLEANPDQQGIFLETAHPIKFLDVVEPVIGKKISLPPAVEELSSKPQYKTPIKADYDQFKEYLLTR